MIVISELQGDQVKLSSLVLVAKLTRVLSGRVALKKNVELHLVAELPESKMSELKVPIPKY